MPSANEQLEPAIKLWTSGVVCECWSAEQQDDQSQSLHPPCFLAPLHLPFAPRDAARAEIYYGYAWPPQQPK
jgi:hypothetical protein